MEDDDYYSGDYLQDILEGELLDLGGKWLLDDAHYEASQYVNDSYPWDREGDEPGERVSAYLAVLWQRAEQARGESQRRPTVDSR
jgi:hypothetical protein